MCASPFFAECPVCVLQGIRKVPVVVESWPRPDMFEVACGYCCERFEVSVADDRDNSKESE